MDVLIKNMEMPSSCVGCKLVQRYRYSDECQYLHKKIAHNGRLKYCPLVEVPKHGRLVEADKLQAKFFPDEEAYKIIENEPTVLEANE